MIDWEIKRTEPNDRIQNMRQRRKKMTLGFLEKPNLVLQPREAQ